MTEKHKEIGGGREKNRSRKKKMKIKLIKKVFFFSFRRRDGWIDGKPKV
jgi:hypothetical protein